jgi:hypothetical protein
MQFDIDHQTNPSVLDEMQGQQIAETKGLELPLGR